jgi:hypothetical protein
MHLRKYMNYRKEELKGIAFLKKLAVKTTANTTITNTTAFSN